MIDCPNCGRQLMPDSSNPMRMKCTYCNYVLDPSADMSPLPGLFPEEEQASASLPHQPNSSFTADSSWNQPLPIDQPQGQPLSADTPPQGQPIMVASPPGYQPPTSIPGGPVPLPNQTPVSHLSKGFAIASLVLGIVALLNCWIPFVNGIAVVLGILGLIFGIISLVQIGGGRATGKGMSIAGIVCSGLALILSIVISVVTFFALSAYIDEYDTLTSRDRLTHEIEDELDDLFNDQILSDDFAEGFQNFSDNAPWTDLTFKLDGKTYTLMQVTFDEFQEQTGWKLDLSEAGYPNGYIVQSGEKIDEIPLFNEAEYTAFIYVDVYNPQKDQCDLGKCKLCSILIYDPANTLDLTLSGGVYIGSTLSEVQNAYGAPSSEDWSSSDMSHYLMYCTSDYTNYLALGLNENERIDAIFLSYIVP